MNRSNVTALTTRFSRTTEDVSKQLLYIRTGIKQIQSLYTFDLVGIGVERAAESALVLGDNTAHRGEHIMTNFALSTSCHLHGTLFAESTTFTWVVCELNSTWRAYCACLFELWVIRVTTGGSLPGNSHRLFRVLKLYHHLGMMHSPSLRIHEAVGAWESWKNHRENTRRIWNSVGLCWSDKQPSPATQICEINDSKAYFSITALHHLYNEFWTVWVSSIIWDRDDTCTWRDV